MSDIGDFYLGSIFDVFEQNSEWFDDEFLEPYANEETSKLENSTDIKNEPATKRFKTVTDNDLEHIVLDSRSKTTLQTTAWGVKILKQWLQFHELSPEFETLPVDEIDALLTRFYAEVRTSDGNYYAKSSYVGIRAAIHRHLRQPPFNMNINILQDKEFHSANAVFAAMLKKIKQLGLDNPAHHNAISDGDLAKIRNKQNLENPVDLQNKVWFDLTIGFGRRGCENQRELSVHSFVVETDDVGCEFISMTHSESTKNHPGGVGDSEYTKPRIYATGTPLCPVVSFRKYMSKLNPENEALFQQPRKNVCENDEVWYTSKPLGHNTLKTMMKRISASCELSRVYTNHCVRSTTLTLLSHAGVEAREIVKITGHKNCQSLSSYNTDSSAAQKRQYSAILQTGSSGHDINNTRPNLSASVPAVMPSPSTSTVQVSHIKAGMSGLIQIGNSSVIINNYFHE